MALFLYLLLPFYFSLSLSLTGAPFEQLRSASTGALDSASQAPQLRELHQPHSLLIGHRIASGRLRCERRTLFDATTRGSSPRARRKEQRTNDGRDGRVVRFFLFICLDEWNDLTIGYDHHLGTIPFVKEVKHWMRTTQNLAAGACGIVMDRPRQR